MDLIEFGRIPGGVNSGHNVVIASNSVVNIDFSASSIAAGKLCTVLGEKEPSRTRPRLR